jgi:hypothetical protein
MKKRVIRLSESDLQRIVKRVIKENMINELGGMDDGHPRFGDVKFSDLSRDEILRMGSSEYSEDSDDDLTDDNEYYDDLDGDIGDLKGGRRGKLPIMRSMTSRHNTGERPFRRGNRKM